MFKLTRHSWNIEELMINTLGNINSYQVAFVYYRKSYFFYASSNKMFDFGRKFSAQKTSRCILYNGSFFLFDYQQATTKNHIAFLC